MKLLIILLLLSTSAAHAQTFDEWFRQEQTQEKYLVQQIAALQAYAGTLRQGYALAREGISTVQHIRNGDLGLHQVYFSSLRLVNPAIRDAPPATGIIHLQAAILLAFETQAHALTSSGSLTPSEQAYLLQVRANVLRACARDLETLWLMLSDDTLGLTDAQRLQQAGALYARTQERLQFTRDFLQQVAGLSWERARERTSLQDILSWYPHP